MPDNTFTVPATKANYSEVPAEPGISQLALEWGTPTEAARATVILKTRDESGEWDSTVSITPFQIEDERAEDGQFAEPRLVTTVNNLILDSVVPADDPRAVAIGMGGKTVREMGEALVKMQLEATDGA